MHYLMATHKISLFSLGKPLPPDNLHIAVDIGLWFHSATLMFYC